MNDTRDLLSEAVGSYEPRGDERAVERRVERRDRRRRISSGVVGLGVFVAAGWLAWTAFGPGSTAGSDGAGTYLVSEFRVQAHVDPATGDAAPGQADVTFASGWSTDRYPGVHACRVSVLGPTGAVIGSRSLEVSSLSRDGVRTEVVVPVRGSVAGATATGSCSQRRLDAPVAVGISDERFEYVDGRLSVVFEVHVPGGRRVGAQACTSAVWSGDGGLLGRVSFTSIPSEGTRHVGLGVDEATARAEAAAATVICAPYDREHEFPEPEEPSPNPPRPEATVSCPTSSGCPGTRPARLCCRSA